MLIARGVELFDELTDGHGVDHTVEVGGPGTLQKSIPALTRYIRG